LKSNKCVDKDFSYADKSAVEIELKQCESIWINKMSNGVDCVVYESSSISAAIFCCKWGSFGLDTLSYCKYNFNFSPIFPWKSIFCGKTRFQVNRTF
jgi:hypothetical protein